MSFYEINEHTTLASSSRRAVLGMQQKAFCRELASQGVHPLRTMNSMRNRFGVGTGDGPSLKTVHNYVNYFLKTQMNNTYSYEAIAAVIQAKNYTGSEDEMSEFTFSWLLDEMGVPIVGDGSDEALFVVGMTTKAMLRRMDRPADSFVFHIDATYKLNQLNYPVFVVGILDACRMFHIVALFVASQQTEAVITTLLASLRRIYLTVTQNPLMLKCTFLMCFFHLVVNVIKNFRADTDMRHKLRAQAVSNVYDLHFTKSPEEYSQKLETQLRAWRGHKDESVRAFTEYFDQQWVTSKFSLWQIYHSPVGFATTNNPAEQYNKAIKRDYTLRKRLKMGMLLKQLLDCCRNETCSPRPFRTNPEPNDSLKRRASQLAHDGFLVANPGALDPLHPLVQRGVRMVVISTPAKRFWIPTKRRTEEYLTASAQLGSKYARMEHEGQPPQGWIVDVCRQWCQCQYYHKFGTCVHFLLALRVTDRVDANGNRAMVNRSVVRRSAPLRLTVPGRPPLNGHALSLQ